ncbi:MAG: ABC transporter ATP-binding protein [Acidimicrobiales bacterium]
MEATPADDPAPIVTRGLTKHYGDLTAVDGLDLELRRGEIFGLLGQNGAGKTTTILMLLGLTEPSEGEARVLGLDPAFDALRVKRQVGYLPDSVGFYSDLTGRENLRYTARLNGLRGEEAEERLEEVSEAVGLGDRVDTLAGTYSRGMLQRLGIADALVKQPQILILDEPTTAIDPIGVVEILALLRRLVDERGVTVLLCSHLLAQVQSVCDRVGIFAAGQLIGLGTVAELATEFGANRGRVEVSFEGIGADRARIADALAAIPQVTEVTPAETADGPWSLVVQPADAHLAVREAVLAAAAEQQLGLTAIRSVTASLEEIYRDALHQSGLAA